MNTKNVLDNDNNYWIGNQSQSYSDPSYSRSNKRPLDYTDEPIAKKPKLNTPVNGIILKSNYFLIQ